MIKRLAPVVCFMFFTGVFCFSQDLNYGHGFRRGIYTNPAFSGVAGDGYLNLSYNNFYPGRKYDLHNLFVAYDTYVPGLHGGTGFFISNDLLGELLNDLRTGFSYSYHLKVSPQLTINAGLTASVITRGMNRGKILLPDMIDPFRSVASPSAEIITTRRKTVFDAGAGFLISYKNITGGISINHFAEPDIYGTSINAHRLRRKFSFQLSGEMISRRNDDLGFYPALFLDIQGDNYSGSAGGSVRYKIVSVNSLLIAGNMGKMDFQAGITINTGKTQLYYCHIINLVSHDLQFPFSIMQMAGVNIRLNSVDKRKVVKTINFPEL